MEKQTVSVVIPAANAARSLPYSIGAVREQSYTGPIETIVAAADEDTARVAASLGARVVANESGTTPDGLNAAVAAANGEVVVRVDAHSIIPRSYVADVVRTLNETGADNVGGMQIPVGRSFWEKATAAAMTSFLGAGAARYRVGGRAGPAETVYLGTYRKETLERFGGFNEQYLRNQDYELNRRIRDAGGTVWFDPSIKVHYTPRPSLPALAKQYFTYGRWKRRFSRDYPGSMMARQVGPPLLVVLLAVTIPMAFFWPLLWVVPGLYALGLVVSGLIEAPRIGMPAAGVPLAIATMHLCWGSGFLIGQTKER